MSAPNDPLGRNRLRNALRRDLERHERREHGSRTFWQSLALIGAVGWSIALCAVGSALLGQGLDHRFGTGVRFTLILLTTGAALGSFLAWRVIRGTER